MMMETVCGKRDPRRRHSPVFAGTDIEKTRMHTVLAWQQIFCHKAERSVLHIEAKFYNGAIRIILKGAVDSLLRHQGVKYGIERTEATEAGGAERCLARDPKLAQTQRAPQLVISARLQQFCR
jgi:hypothetical protein